MKRNHERSKLGGDSEDGSKYDVDCDGIQSECKACKVGSGSEAPERGAVTMESRAANVENA